MKSYAPYFLLLHHLLLDHAGVASQRGEGPEDFRFEITGSAWLTGPTGKIRADGTPIDFVSDLAAGSKQPRFYGGLVFKPGRKHRLILEGTPLSFSGRNTIDRSIVFLNHTYSVSQNVVTNANMNYAFGGYQYDPIVGAYGHVGLQVGVACFNVQGTLHGIESGLSETKSAQTPIPLVGTEFRVFPIPHHKLIEVQGMLRGLPAGDYGYFLEGGGSGGLRLGPISVLAGYREMFANVHQDNALRNGVAVHLKGPIFSVQWQW